MVMVNKKTGLIVGAAVVSVVILVIIVVVATQGRPTTCKDGLYNHNDRC